MKYLLLTSALLASLGSSAEVVLPVRTVEGEEVSRVVIAEPVWPEVVSAFRAGAEVLGNIETRRTAYNAFAKAMGYEELPPSDGVRKHLITVENTTYDFDDGGELWCDARFALPEEMPALHRIEAYYRSFLKPTKAESPAVAVAPAPAVPQPAPSASALPVFRGFEHPRYQQHDALILQLVNDFNAHRDVWADCTPRQLASIRKLNPALIKSQMIEETGGASPRSRRAWKVDPLQVNVPGDWSEVKRKVGLAKPAGRNEGSARQNVEAAIKYLVRKGFGVAAQPAKAMPDRDFGGWFTAIRRYNGRKSRSFLYAERIRRRASSPHIYVPIAVDRKGKGQ